MNDYKRYGLMVLFISLIIIPLSSSQIQTLGTFKLHTCIDLPQVGNVSFCNITKVTYVPNSTVILRGALMEKNGMSFNYTICTVNFTGEYNVEGHCDGTPFAYNFFVNPAGMSPTTSQGGLSIGILLSIVFVMFFFGWLGFKFMEGDSTFPIGIFFVILAIIISAYGLYLGVDFSSNYLYSATSNVQAKVFMAVLLGLGGIMFIGMTLLTIAAIKEFKERKSIQRYGGGFNNNTQMYD